MKSAVIVFVLSLLCGKAIAEKSIHEGVYEVPRMDGKIIHFPSTIEFEGDTINEAREFTVLFPTQLVGIENRFTIKKVEQGWVGDKDLFDMVDCATSKQYDFTCFLKFNKEAVIDITEPLSEEKREQAAILEWIPLMAADGLTPQSLLKVDRNLAKSNMAAAGFSPEAIAVRSISAIDFVNEPIGFLNYRSEKYVNP